MASTSSSPARARRTSSVASYNFSRRAYRHTQMSHAISLKNPPSPAVPLLLPVLTPVADETTCLPAGCTGVQCLLLWLNQDPRPKCYCARCTSSSYELGMLTG